MIPIARPYIGKREIAAAKKVISSGWLTQGPQVKRFEELFASYVRAPYACAVSSCTTALHLSLLAVGVKPGDVVITVSHSFIATANSIRHSFAEPIFVDIDPDTYNMSPECLKECLVNDCEEIDGQLYYKKILNMISGESPLCYCRNKGANKKSKTFGRVGAIMPVHQMGMPCDLAAILKLARKFNIPVVEDAACAIGSEISVNKITGFEKIGKPHGDIACFSFHPRKIITTGDGGMITTNNPDYDKRVRLLRHHGMDVSDALRHNLKKVLFEEYLTTGYNYRMTDIQASIGIEQLKSMPYIIKKRRHIGKLYYEGLKDVSWIKLPEERDYYRTNWQSYPIMILNTASICRDTLMQRLLDIGVSTRRGIMNAHQEKPYDNTKWPLRNSEIARDSVILLPIFCDLKLRDINRIVRLIKDA